MKELLIQEYLSRTLNFEFVCYVIMWSVHAPACTDYNPQNKGSDKVSCDYSGIDTGFFARGGNIFIECAEADV